MTMRGILIPAVAAGFAALVLAGPKPAAALPGPGTLAQTGTDTSLKQDVAKRYRYGKWNKRYGYRNYAYRPYYGGYRRYGYYGGYRPYYYRPYYGYGGWGYPYYRRPGVSLWFGF